MKQYKKKYFKHVASDDHHTFEEELEEAFKEIQKI